MNYTEIREFAKREYDACNLDDVLSIFELWKIPLPRILELVEKDIENNFYGMVWTNINHGDIEIHVIGDMIFGYNDNVNVFSTDYVKLKSETLWKLFNNEVTVNV